MSVPNILVFCGVKEVVAWYEGVSKCVVYLGSLGIKAVVIQIVGVIYRTSRKVG